MSIIGRVGPLRNLAVGFWLSLLFRIRAPSKGDSLIAPPVDQKLVELSNDGVRESGATAFYGVCMVVLATIIVSDMWRSANFPRL